MDEVGLARSCATLAACYNQIPFVTTPALDLGDYATDKALAGLFTVLGQEEQKIREKPSARSTELLRKGFAR